MTNDYIIMNGELYHYGVKGMKWGVRRYQNPDGSLTAKGIKKYATKQYAKDSYNMNKTVVGKAWDRYTGAHKIHAKAMETFNTKAQNEAAAKKYLKDQNAKKKRAQKAVQKGTKKAASALRTIGVLAVTDQLATGGLGRKVVGATIKHTGRAVVSAWVYANGGRDIHWYDN